MRRQLMLIMRLSFMLQLAVADLHGQAWFQGFNDAGQIIFNRSANEIMQMKVCLSWFYDLSSY